MLKTKYSGKYLCLTGIRNGQFGMLNNDSVCDTFVQIGVVKSTRIRGTGHVVRKREVRSTGYGGGTSWEDARGRCKDSIKTEYTYLCSGFYCGENMASGLLGYDTL